MRTPYIEHDPANNKPYVEYYPPLWRKTEKDLTIDDETKRKAIGTLMRTKPLTLLLLIIAICAVIAGLVAI